jgi:hypothetical protein
VPIGNRIPRPGSLQLLGLAALGPAAMFLAITAFFGGRSTIAVLAGERVPATVVDYSRNRKGGGTPIVEFSTKSGARVRFEGTASSTPPEYEVGEAIHVRYLESHPGLAVIDSFLEMWVLAVVCGPLGIVGVVVGISMCVAGFRRKRARNRAASSGWRLSGVVASAKPIQLKGGVQYQPVVEARHPQTGEVLLCFGERQAALPAPGAPAWVYLDPAPPYAYFVELA